MSSIKKTLQKIGLTENESTIYIEGLKYHELSVNDLEKKTRIKRTTIYHVLDTLMFKGLVSKKGRGNKNVFIMTNPEKIKSIINSKIQSLQNQKEDFSKIIPLLIQKQKKNEEKIKVQHYEGIEGIKLVVEEALYCKSRKWDIIAPRKNFFSEFDKGYSKYFMHTRKENRIKTRALWEDKFNNKLSAEDIKQRNPRILPKTIKGKFKSVIITFDDKVAIISSIDKLSAILIQSKETQETFSIMFEGLWLVSKKYREID